MPPPPPPPPPLDGAALTVVDCAAASLFDVLSVLPAATLALAVAVPAEPAVVPILIVALAPFASALSVQLTVEPLGTHVPAAEVALVAVAPTKLTVTVAATTSSGPLFVTVAV
jgi:hypothetical protein